ncbi:hypothetical protein AB0393_28785 [Streptomyces cyaneofuscatus]|uniref:hypothetical protein n=1 Tax=Streptomyces cyaneofuscatus TaxID=66883 RepID=UPI00344E47B6
MIVATWNPQIGDNVLPALRPTPNGLRAWWRPRRPLSVVHTVEDLVARVIGTLPLPGDDAGVTLLLVGLRRQLPRLERIVEDMGAAPDAVRQARRIRAEAVPEGRMPLVILTIRLAEIAQALIDAAQVGPVPQPLDTQILPFGERRGGAPQSAAGAEFDEIQPVPRPVLARPSVPSAVPTSLSHRGSSPVGQLISAAAGPPGNCGPPP